MLINNYAMSVRRLTSVRPPLACRLLRDGQLAGDLHVHLVGKSAEQHEIGPAVLTAPQNQVNLMTISLMNCINPSSKQREKERKAFGSPSAWRL